jgi:ATP-binding cassette subfamily F protein 2
MEAAGLIEKIEIPKPLNFRFENIRKLPPPILAFNEVAFSYSGKKEDYLYKNLSFGIESVSFASLTYRTHVWLYSMDSRIAILGANGTGKSTLLNLITSALQPVEGTISKHTNLKLAKYSQHSADQLPYNQSPLEHFQQLFAEKFPEKDLQVFYSLHDVSVANFLQAWRAQLGRFGLSGTHQTSPIRQLSDGLRNRYVYRNSMLGSSSLYLASCFPNFRWNTRTYSFSVRHFVNNVQNLNSYYASRRTN